MTFEVKTDLEGFSEFVRMQVANASVSLSPEHVLAMWRERAETIEAIRRGMEDVEAGRVTPADEVLEKLRKELQDS
jgi:predicted transcriptional regulator